MYVCQRTELTSGYKVLHLKSSADKYHHRQVADDFKIGRTQVDTRYSNGK